MVLNISNSCSHIFFDGMLVNCVLDLQKHVKLEAFFFWLYILTKFCINFCRFQDKSTEFYSDNIFC